MQIVVCALHNEEYALPITNVQEIIRHTAPRPIHQSGNVEGVINLRGRIVPVADLGSYLGLAAADTTDARIVIIENGSASAGIVVESVSEVLTVEETEIEAIESATAVIGVVKIDSRLVALLDPHALLAELGAGEAVAA